MHMGRRLLLHLDMAFDTGSEDTSYCLGNFVILLDLPCCQPSSKISKCTSTLELLGDIYGDC